MLGFIKKCFFTGLACLSILTSVNLLSAAPLSFVSINNQGCSARLQIVDVKSK